MRNTIFTYCNFQIDPEIPNYQAQVIDKMISNLGIDFNPLRYNAKDGDMVPDQVIDYGINELYNQGYDNILILDIDCIPLNIDALTYTFHRATQGVLIGNAQRSNHLDNNKHVFIGSSCICLNRNVYEQLGRPSFRPTNRGDIAEELVYIADDIGLPKEIHEPLNYEASPYGVDFWPLDDVMPPYGIGTTFKRYDGHPMFYHLFESRLNINVERFVNKCKSILEK